ncbi:MAG: hypothetical protein KDB07_07360 [Planctomycetes bacterium]|nr:hypothetical protein [Planctomycetota bacterium]
MLTVSEFLVRTFDLDYIDVWWEIADTVEDHLNYSFYLYRSESPQGPWSQLAGPFKDRWYFRDVTVNQKHRHRRFYYRLRLVEDATGNEEYTAPATIEAESSLEAQEMVRRFALLLREFVGRKIIHFPVRTFGTRCPDCWDEIRYKKTKDKCLTCYNTGYAGGFMSPILTFLQFDPAPDSSQAGSAGESQDTKTTARGLPFPPFKPSDIIVEAENRRWRVMVSSDTERLRSPVHSELQLDEVHRGDIVYKLPINLDVRNFDPSPGRAIKPPYAVEELVTREPEIEDVLRIYGFPYTK